ncbi:MULTISPECIES: response regulator [Rothia]|uniref:Response regulator transcription factor n=1 Tax=Rothia amarae TaxID=169480 RepID=A0A7H2BJL6_9MICC|nr:MULTISPECIES: response regulator transcription factor [Rothia]QNV39862.1 response regulator transcription factor [Rothia amarae]SIL69022.1 two component LuxR family transcriptional regulator [Mycobacteroides abscessus subsp. abscessus]
MDTLKILVVDDQSLMRQAMTSFVTFEKDMEVVAQASDGAEAVNLALQLKPDVILMDLQMPVMNGIDATSKITAALPSTKVLAVTTFHSEDYVVPALKAGASGYIVKDSEPEDIINAIRSVHEGNSVLSPSIARLLVDNLAEEAVERRMTATDVYEWSQLTSRERDVVKLLCDGYSNREIASTLFLSEPTVKTHVAHIASKVDARDRLQIVVKAYRSNVLKTWD